VGLLVVDSSIAPVEKLRPAVASHGTIVTIGTVGQYVLYPSAENPEQIWRPGWPLPVVPGLAPQLRRALGLWASRQRHVPRLHLQGGSEPSTADRVLTSLFEQTGTAGRLVGVHTGGCTILRVRQGGEDVAVRLSLSDADRRVDAVSRVLADVPAIAPFVPPTIASGRAVGRAWVATPWYPRRRGLLLSHWRAQSRRWVAAEQLVAAMQAVPTGATARGWAHDWCEAVALLPADLRERLVMALEILEEIGVPTGWSHGDLWPGNILLGGAQAKIIDWDNATPRGPQGLDWLLIAAFRAARRRSTSMGQECVRLVDGPGAERAVIGGRNWMEWDHRCRVALSMTAFLLYLRNRSRFNLAPDQLAAELEPVQALLDATGAGR
jgi:hypothetical protein